MASDLVAKRHLLNKIKRNGFFLTGTVFTKKNLKIVFYN